MKLVGRSEDARRKAVTTAYASLFDVERTPLFKVIGATSSVSNFFGGSKLSASYLTDYVRDASTKGKAYTPDKGRGENKKAAKNIYAELPDDIASDPNDINRINRAGELFIEHGKCPPLNKGRKQFKQKIQSVNDVDTLVNSIMAALQLIPVACAVGAGNIEKVICTNPNDLREILATVLKSVWESTSIQDSTIQEWHSPLVTPEGSVSWLKVKFTTEMNISDCCGMFFTTKEMELFLEYYTFWFPSVEDFDHALQFVENQRRR